MALPLTFDRSMPFSLTCVNAFISRVILYPAWRTALFQQACSVPKGKRFASTTNLFLLHLVTK
jgi:hypothetical protein